MIDALPVEIKGQYASTLEQLNTGVRSSTPRDVLSANNLLKRLLETCERFHVQDYEGHMQRLEHEMEQAVRENSHLTGVDDDNSSKKSGGRFLAVGGILIGWIPVLIVIAMAAGIFGEDSRAYLITGLSVFLLWFLVVVAGILMIPWGIVGSLQIRSALTDSNAHLTRITAHIRQVERQRVVFQDAYAATLRHLQP